MTRSPIRTLHGLQYATWFAVATSAAIFATFVWTHVDQRSAFARSIDLLDRFRQARIDLASGFTHVVLGAREHTPFDRAQGLALLRQAIADMRVTRSTDAAAEEPAEAGRERFEEAAEAFMRHLDELASDAPDREAVETSLRVAFAHLEREAHRVDLGLQRALRDLRSRLDRNFHWAIALAGTLLAGMTAGVRVVGRQHMRSVLDLRASEDRLETVIEHLAEGVILAEDNGRLIHWNRAAMRMHGLADQRDLRSMVADYRDAFELRTVDGAFVPFEDWPANRLLRGEGVQDLELRVTRRASGVERVFVYNGANVRIAGDRALSFLSLVDVTERRRTEDSLRLFRRLVDASLDSFEIIDPESGRLLDANAALCEALGYSREELLRLRIFDIAPNRSEQTWAEDAARVRAGTLVRSEGQLRRRDGTTFPVEFTASWVEIDRPYLVAVVRDITERKRVERDLREQQDKLVKLAESSPSVVCAFRLGPDGRVTFPYSSPKIRDIYEHGPDELAEDGSLAARRWHPDDVEPLMATIEASRRELKPWHGAFRVIHPRHGILWIEGHSVPAAEPDGSTIWYGVLTDVTERKRVADELQENARLLTETGYLAKVGGWQLDPATGVGRWTPEVARIHDLDPHLQPSAELSLQCYPGEARTRLEEAVRAAITRGEPYDLELPFVSATGKRKWIRTICRPLVENGTVVRVSGAIQDISERKQAELRAEVLLATTRAIADNTDLAPAAKSILEVLCQSLGWDLGELWIFDRRERRLRFVEMWSRPGLDTGTFARVSRLMTFTPGEGVPGRIIQTRELAWIDDVRTDGAYRRKREAVALGLCGAVGVPIASREEAVGAMLLYSRAAHPPDSSTSATLMAVGAQVGQSMERRQLEAQVLRSQKLEAIGTLAGGIAHDFNNILSAIVGFAGLARMSAEGNSEVQEYVDDILTASKRATDLVRQILAFSRVQESSRQVVQLRHILEEARKLLRASIPASIEFESRIDPNTPPVLADPTQVHQIIMNLGTNAAHAMQGRTGRLQFSLTPLETTEADAVRHPGLRPGSYAMLSVGDTGHGMDAETLGRIFDPFFTTKAPGEGTGLGLSVVHGIMQRHDGVILVQSQPGVGTRFDLYFPAHASVPEHEPAAPARPPRGAGQRILCVDDEELLVRATRMILQGLGYQVVTSTDPHEALAQFRAEPGSFGAVLVDLTMPHMLGTELGRRLLEVRPDVPVILMTGYAASLTRDKAIDAGFADLLIKPITMDQLARIVHRALSGTRRGDT